MDCYITGTDTGAGKTWTTCATLRALAARGLRAAAQKPVAAGTEIRNGREVNEDVCALAAHANVPLSSEVLNPYLFKAPTAPHVAAALEGREIDFNLIASRFRQAQPVTDVLLVEGVGGWCLPFGPDGSQRDLVARLNLPVILVAGIRLGALNHALLTTRAIEADGARLIGWVANIVDPAYAFADATVEALAERIGAPCFGTVPWETTRSAEVPTAIDRMAQLLAAPRSMT